MLRKRSKYIFYFANTQKNDRKLQKIHRKIFQLNIPSKHSIDFCATRILYRYLRNRSPIRLEIINPRCTEVEGSEPSPNFSPATENHPYYPVASINQPVRVIKRDDPPKRGRIRFRGGYRETRESGRGPWGGLPAAAAVSCGGQRGWREESASAVDREDAFRVRRG